MIIRFLTSHLIMSRFIEFHILGNEVTILVNLLGSVKVRKKVKEVIVKKPE